MDVFDRLIEWVLKRDPTHFFHLRDEYFLWKFDVVIKDFPQLEILYRYDKDKNTIHLLRAREIKGS